jgi:hypothetical protein
MNMKQRNHGERFDLPLNLSYLSWTTRTGHWKRNNENSWAMVIFKQWTWMIVLFTTYLRPSIGAATNAGVKQSSQVVLPDLYEASIMDLQQGLNAQHFSSVDLVKVRVQGRKGFG